MNNISTFELGIQITESKIEELGGTNIQIHKEGNRKFITFTSPNGNEYKVTTRSKKAGTWQTMTTYGKPCNENPSEREYWAFIDLGFKTPKFYLAPFWWVSNNIYEAHQKYLRKHEGHRKINDNSNHHAIRLKRIQSWENKWEQIGL